MLRLATRCATQVGRIVNIVTATHNVLLTRRGTLGIDRTILHLRVSILGIPIRAILHHVTQHILQSERVSLHLGRLLCAVLTVVHIDNVAIDNRRICTEQIIPETVVSVILRATLEVVRRVRTTASCILPLRLSRQTVLLAGLERKPLAEGLSRIVRHRDCGT